LYSSIKTFEKIYMSISYEERDWAKDNGFKWDPKGKAWYLPPGEDPLPFKDCWSYLENTFHDKEQLKKRGCRYNSKLKKWYVPLNAKTDYDDFHQWWPKSLKQFIFSERFVVQEFISRTGQAEMFKARDPKTNEDFAVKYFLSEVANLSDAEVRRGIGGEIDSLLMLDHPNIMRPLDWGQKKETSRWFVISQWSIAGDLDEYIGLSEEDALYKFGNIFNLDQELIEELIEEEKNSPKDLWLDDFFIILSILNAIVHAHSRNILHRDIKPRNILLDIDLEDESCELIPQLCDFGAAKIYDGVEIKQSAHTVVGFRTPPYRPEFIGTTEEGQIEIEYQETWDLFSWAILAIEIAANKRVETSDEAICVLHNDLAPELDEEIVRLLVTAMAKDPKDRPKDIEVFRDTLHELTEKRKKRLGWKE
jgi:serine/threonine protein kinase